MPHCYVTQEFARLDPFHRVYILCTVLIIFHYIDNFTNSNIDNVNNSLLWSKQSYKVDK